MYLSILDKCKAKGDIGELDQKIFLGIPGGKDIKLKVQNKICFEEKHSVKLLKI